LRIAFAFIHSGVDSVPPALHRHFHHLHCYAILFATPCLPCCQLLIVYAHRFYYTRDSCAAGCTYALCLTTLPAWDETWMDHTCPFSTCYTGLPATHYRHRWFTQFWFFCHCFHTCAHYTHFTYGFITLTAAACRPLAYASCLPTAITTAPPASPAALPHWDCLAHACTCHAVVLLLHAHCTRIPACLSAPLSHHLCPTCTLCHCTVTIHTGPPHTVCGTACAPFTPPAPTPPFYLPRILHFLGFTLAATIILYPMQTFLTCCLPRDPLRCCGLWIPGFYHAHTRVCLRVLAAP